MTTASAVVTSMPSMRVKSTPHILDSCVRRSNFGALRALAALLALGRLAVREPAGHCSCRFDLAVALGQLRADEVEQRPSACFSANTVLGVASCPAGSWRCRRR